MYKPPQSFDNLVSDLSEYTATKQDARIMAYVELTLYLAKQLGLEAEPLTIGWVLLSKIPLHHIKLENLSDTQRQMYANAAIIVPLSSRAAWENALAVYEKRIDSEIKLYRIPERTRLDEFMIELAFQTPCPDPLREERYAKILSEPLPFNKREQRAVTLEQSYKVNIKASDGTIRTGRIKITPDMIRETMPEWFTEPRPHHVLTIKIDDLLPTAQFLDMREQQLGGRTHWVKDLGQIRFSKVQIIDGEITLEQPNTHPLRLEGNVHLPGMVSAGKTTLAKLIIAHCILTNADIRITLVVGDSQTAISIANQVNSWFYDDPAGDDVIALPLLGTTQRETHLNRLFDSREYMQSLSANRPHWGERWLMPVCPLSAKIKWEGEQNVTIPAGHEPCTRLIEEIANKKKKGKRHLCPLFYSCPSQQIYRDMPSAQLWVITPGALAQASLPLHLDPRIGKMGDLVYEQSDLVIFDEVETIVEWFDRTFAKTVDLTNGKNGLLDKLDVQHASAWSFNRVIPSNERRWVMALRDSLKTLAAILTAIDNEELERVVKNWVKERPFAPNQLAYRLARRLAGLKEWDSLTKTSLEERLIHDEKTQIAFAPFNRLLNQIDDPLRLQTEASDKDVPVNELARLMQSINNLADDMADVAMLKQCEVWITTHYPDIKERLLSLYQQLKQSDDPHDKDYLKDIADRNVEELAHRLKFMLTVALLDRHMHIIIQEWHNKPENLDAEQPFSHIPQGMRNILPLPLTGQQYGFISGNKQNNHEANNKLSMFMYTNIGRSYILNYTHLRKDFDGRSGPNVLALSGTSWLPDSSQFHVSSPLAGVLLAPQQTEKAIRDSRFIWHPFTDENNRPIAISGKRDKNQQLRKLVQAMQKYGTSLGGFIGEELAWLREQAQVNPDQWEDRSRILMLTNSYQQAESVTKALRALQPDIAHTIFNLKRGDHREDFEVEYEQEGILRRTDIEQFAINPNAQILVAPMQSIGRGFNILNNTSPPKAAFGTIFFLIRHMRPPNVNMIAQELNYYSLHWVNSPGFGAWQEATLYQRAIKARQSAVEVRRMSENYYGYKNLRENPALQVYQRRDLAASIAGQMIQAIGRLLRGAVPFRAYFIDAAWSPELAQNGRLDQVEAEETSLLTAVINIMQDYAARDEIGYQLYNGISEALTTTINRDSN